MINQEEIYKLLKSENWKTLIETFHRKKDIIKSDIMLMKALETTLSVITDKALKLECDKEFIDNLESILMLEVGKFIFLKDEQKEAIVVAIINGKKANISYCYNYAKDYPNNKICKEIIDKYEVEYPQKIKHSQKNKVTATENKSIESNVDCRKSLFNSIQEVEFYLALKRVFDTYQVYPNIGLSSVIHFEQIKEHLSEKERNFFFKSSVDFVVLEPFRNYYPIYFFEVDSIWHDSEEQKEKDSIKDKIFSLSGLKLFRIRKIDKTIDETEFEKLIRELRKSTEMPAGNNK